MAKENLTEELLTAADRMADARERLDEVEAVTREEVREALRARLEELDEASVEYSAARENLLEETMNAPDEVWAESRTKSHRGIKFGVRVMPLRLVIPNEEVTIELIYKEMGIREAAGLIKERRSVIKTEAKKLDEGMLRALGMKLEGGHDECYVQQERDPVEKLATNIVEAARDAETESARERWKA